MYISSCAAFTNISLTYYKFQNKYQFVNILFQDYITDINFYKKKIEYISVLIFKLFHKS